jgi:hypothetical protein
MKTAQAFTHIVLRGVPRSSLPSDIRRVVRKSNVEGVTSGVRLFASTSRPDISIKPVMLNYHRFIPTGSAYLAFSRPNYIPRALKALKGASIASIPLRATSCPPPKVSRNRGAEGRRRAAEREAIDGCGPRAGLGLGGQNVIIWGLPEDLPEAEFKNVLCDVELAGTAGGIQDVYKVPK